MTPEQDRPRPPARLRAVLVLGSSTGGVGIHVRSLAAGLADRGVAVTVCGPAATEELFGFTAAGARFAPVEIGTGPRPADIAAARALRDACAGAHVVHAHGLRAGLLAVSALGRRRPGRAPLVLTLHNAVLARGARGQVARVMEGRAVRGADVVLGASGDLVARARELGARDARLAPVAAPPAAPAREAGGRDEPEARDSDARDSEARDRARAELGAPDGTPVVLAIGRLAPQKDYPVLMDAAASWRALDPRPLVAVVGEGPLREELQGRVDAEDLPVRLLGHREHAAELFAGADVAVLPSRWEARSLVAQEALRSGVPLVATAVGGIPELVGDAAVLVPAGDAAALADAVAALLADPARRARLAELGPRQAETWPGESDTVAQVLSVYEELGPM